MGVLPNFLSPFQGLELVGITPFRGLPAHGYSLSAAPRPEDSPRRGRQKELDLVWATRPSVVERAAKNAYRIFLGWAAFHSCSVTDRDSCRKTKAPFLFPITKSRRPSLFRSPVTSCRPMPELSSMR